MQERRIWQFPCCGQGPCSLHRWLPYVTVAILPATGHSPDLSTQAVKTLIQAFISCRLDYCNSPSYGITEGLMSRLQSVQNAAACLVSGARLYDCRPHYASTSCCTCFWSTSGGFQDGYPGLPVTVRLLAADRQLVSDEGRR